MRAEIDLVRIDRRVRLAHDECSCLVTPGVESLVLRSTSFHLQLLHLAFVRPIA